MKEINNYGDKYETLNGRTESATCGAVHYGRYR